MDALVGSGDQVCLSAASWLSDFKALFSSGNRFRALSDAFVLPAGRCDAGHKIANRPYAHGSSRTLVTANLRALTERKVFVSENGAPVVQLVYFVIFTLRTFYRHGGLTVTRSRCEGMKSGTTEQSLHL